jgi:Sap, sulfolipid-1-addressing protein
MSFATLLPMAFVMVAGPQILSAVFLATSENWRRNSIAFMAGAAVSITAVVTAAYLLSDGASQAGASDTTLYVVVLVLLVAAMIRAYVKRQETQPPKWMGRLQTASPGFSFKLGLLLLGIFPTDILTSVAVGTYLAAHDEPWWQGLPFVGLTLLILAIPALLLLGFGPRAQAFLPKAREWMTTNSWIVNEIVLVFFVAITISNLA